MTTWVKDANGNKCSEARDYVRRRRDTGPLSAWTITRDTMPQASDTLSFIALALFLGAVLLIIP